MKRLPCGVKGCGMPRPCSIHLPWTRDRILTTICLAAVDGVATSSNQVLHTVALRMFGSWDDACCAAGVQSRAAICGKLKHCSIPGCAKSPRSPAARLCEMHYGRMRRNGHLERLYREPPKVFDDDCHQCGKTIVNRRAWYFCSERCHARYRRGVSEDRRLCIVCRDPLPLGSRADRVFCSWSCGDQARGKGISTNLVGRRDKWRCHICHRKVERKDASVDHLIPVSLGGETEIWNVALAHLSCNSQRGAGRLPAQLLLASFS
jgi:5-methylcytosine-specific restriction endonuclease McrA